MESKAYFSFIEQTLHYFNRQHEQALTQPIDSVAAWRGEDMPSLDEAAYRLSAAEVEEVLSAVAVASTIDKPVKELVAADFPLPLLSARICQWREQLADGAGLQVIRGVPVERWTEEEAELFFWCFGLHLGRPGEQNPEGHLLGHVTDTGARSEDTMTRLYKTAANIEYHCDLADVVGLLCEPVLLDVRDKDVDEAGSSFPIQPCCYANGKLRTFYHSDYFRSVTRHADVPPLTKLEQELFDTYEAIAAEPGMYLDMDLQPGDIQLLSNHTNLHARTAYEDFEDPAEHRHLLRLWLSLPVS
jgi:hypothetical protein